MERGQLLGLLVAFSVDLYASTLALFRSFCALLLSLAMFRAVFCLSLELLRSPSAWENLRIGGGDDDARFRHNKLGM